MAVKGKPRGRVGAMPQADTQPSKISPLTTQTLEQKEPESEVYASVDVVKQVSKPQKYKKHTVNLDEQPVEYELIRPNGMVYFLKTSDIVIYDKKLKKRREIRYTENDPSIFVDEQGDFVKRVPVKFRYGSLIVGYDNPTLREFLDIHPDNEANGGNIFKKLDESKEEEMELETIFASEDAVRLIKKSDINELMPLVLQYGIDPSGKDQSIKLSLVRQAKANPTEFMKKFNDPIVKLRAIVKNAVDFDILKTTANGVYWFDTNSMIITVPSGKDPIRMMAEYLTTERGLAVLSNIQDQLGDI